MTEQDNGLFVTPYEELVKISWDLLTKKEQNDILSHPKGWSISHWRTKQKGI